MGIATRLGTENVLSFNMLEITDYGRPMKPFFIESLGLGKHIGQIHFGAFGVVSAEISVPILVSESLYIRIPTSC